MPNFSRDSNIWSEVAEVTGRPPRTLSITFCTSSPRTPHASNTARVVESLEVTMAWKR
jgi:hypothetical protein